MSLTNQGQNFHFAFNVSIRADHPQLKFIDLTFSMASMNMGFNHYRLVEAASSWRTNVILPSVWQ